MLFLRVCSNLSRYRNCVSNRIFNSTAVTCAVNQNLIKRHIHDYTEKELTQRSKMLSDLYKLPGGNIDLKLNDENGIAVMKLNFPEKKNALTGRMIAQLSVIVKQLQNWQSGKGLVIMGADNFFCAGMDINTVSHVLTPEDGFAIGKYMHEQLNAILNLPLISVCYIEGKALGGGSEITTATDFRIMAPDAEIGFIHPRLNALTGWGGGSHLTGLLGRNRALQLLSSGEIVNAEQAFTIGLTNEVVHPRGHAEKTAIDWLRKYTFSSVDSVRGKKTTVTAAAAAAGADIKYALNVELEMIRKVWGSESHLKALKKVFPKKF
ncbi:ethylmalonyl-CoA decarboxylase-like isoform X2 [Tubulanus polymorphus]|uniref:ethylmalonyl-CoA decarboxylase-like isoform X2 n=1 Tax=Tubulanus polymorphus TaxID=672921 RepID=UPI003DA2DE20